MAGMGTWLLVVYFYIGTQDGLGAIVKVFSPITC